MISGPKTAAGGLLLAAATLMLATTPAFPNSGRRPAEAETLTRRLCDAVQALPEARKAQCCGTTPGGGLAAECARELAHSLRDDALTLDPADVDRCAADSARDLDGCDWVTPYLPRLPPSCRGIVHGRLDLGQTCRSSLECRDGLHCRRNGPTAPGVCVPPDAPGAFCGSAGDELGI